MDFNGRDQWVDAHRNQDKKKIVGLVSKNFKVKFTKISRPKITENTSTEINWHLIELSIPVAK